MCSRISRTIMSLTTWMKKCVIKPITIYWSYHDFIKDVEHVS